MKLAYQDYSVLIKNSVNEIRVFGDDTSLPYTYLKDRCNRIIEILDTLNAEFPNEFKNKGMSNE